MGDYVIIKLCGSGCSNEIISKYLDIEPESILIVLDKYLEFKGHSENLPFNPLKEYRLAGTMEEFVERISLRHGTTYATNALYDICKRISALEEALNENWI
jgi:hypothetical protein